MTFPGVPSPLLQTSIRQTSEPSSVQVQTDALAGSFREQATDWRSLASMMAGGAMYRVGRVGTMALGSGNTARALSVGVGLTAEVSAFEFTHRGLNSAHPGNPNLWRWNGEGGLRQGLLASFITFGALKSGGRLAQGENVVVQHLLQDTGMVLGHQVSGRLGITPHPTGSLAEQFLHAEATNLQLGAGMALAHRVAPGVQALERGLDLSIPRASREEAPPLPNMQSALPTHQAALAGRHTSLREAESRSSDLLNNSILMMEGRGPSILEARSRTPGSSGSGKGRRRTKTQAASPSLRFEDFHPLLRNGIHDLADIPQAFQLLERLGGPWAQMVETMDRLRQERIAAGETGLEGEAFAIRTSSEGTYCARNWRNRRTELADSIHLTKGQSIFGLIHELTHALPLNELPPEFARLPYRNEEDLEALSSRRPTFAEIYRTLLEHAYQNEAISMLAEISLYRDLKRTDVPLNELIHEAERRELEEALELYEQEGPIAYLNSERYVGRNHRSSYSLHRIAQAALMAVIDPRILADPSLHRVLADQGFGVKGGEKILGRMDSFGALLKNPSSEEAFRLLQSLSREGLQVTVDLPTLMEQLREFSALASGAERRASASFLGRERIVQNQVQLLAELRRHFELFRQEVMDLKPGGRVMGEAESMTPDRQRGLLAYYRFAHLLARVAEEEARISHESQAAEAKNLFGFKEKTTASSLLLLEEARLRNQPERINTIMPSVFAGFSGMSGHGFEVREMNEYRAFCLSLVVEMLADPLLHQASARLPSRVLKDAVESLISNLAYDQTPLPVKEQSIRLILSLFPHASAGLFPRDGAGLFPKDRGNLSDFEMTDGRILSAQVFARFGEISIPKDLPEFVSLPLKYQRTLRAQSLGHPLPHRSENLQGDPAVQPPILFWLGEPLEGTPPSVQIFPKIPFRLFPQGIVTRGAEPLIPLHLALERWEREAELPLNQLKAIETDLIASRVFFEEVFLQRIEGDQGFGPEASWISTRLAARWLELAARRGHDTWALETSQEILNDLSRSSHPIVSHCRQEIEWTRRLLTFHGEQSPEGRARSLDNLMQEYESAIRLRREGFSPVRVANFIRRFGAERSLRPQIERLLTLTIEHLAVLNPRSTVFREGVKSVIAAIDGADLVHAEKDRLMGELFHQVLPENFVSAPAATLSFRQRLEAFEWLRSTMLSEETLQKVGLYPSAEDILLERSQSLLLEISSMPLPFEIRGQIMELAFRLEKYMQDTHPEIFDPRNQETLSRVSDQARYQAALGEVIPSRRRMLDPSLPVEEWDPILVRRGMPDMETAWRHLRLSLENDLSSSAPEGNFWKNFEAFLLREIETSGKPTDALREIQDLAGGYMERRQGQGSRSTALSAALSVYTRIQRLLSSQERVLLEQLTTLPSVAWALSRLESAFAEGRDLTEGENRLYDALLAAPTVSDAQRKRELFLLLLGDERLPLALRRRAALGLAHGSLRSETLSNLLEGYASRGDRAGEERLHRSLLNYWERTGQFPDDEGLLLLEELGREGEENLWSGFDQVFSEASSRPIEVPLLELAVLRRGRTADRFLSEMEAFLRAPQPETLNLIYRESLARLLPESAEERVRLLPLLNELRRRRLARLERLDVIRLLIPAAFSRQVPELRFLVLSYLKNMNQSHTQSLLGELREMGEEQSDAEVFRHFFTRTGLEKVGQFLSTLVGMIPEEDRALFAQLQDRVPPGSLIEVRRTVERELNRPLEEVFSEWEETPVASASMGEVYRARLRSDGSLVYVKVIPPSKWANVGAAIEALRRVAADYEAQQDRFQTPLNIPGFIRNLAEQLEQQRNFSIERRQAAQSEGVVFPEFDYDLSTDRMNVMRPAPGVKVTELQDPAARARAAEAYSRQALRMLLVEGYYHGDPHPGNVFWENEEGRLTWLDWGVIGRMRSEDRQNFTALLLSGFAGEGAQISALRRLLDDPREESLERLRNRLQENPLRGSGAERLNQLLNHAGSERIYLSPPMMNAVGYLMTVQGVVRELDPNRDFQQDLMDVLIELPPP